MFSRKQLSTPAEKFFNPGKKGMFSPCYCTRCCKVGVTVERIIGVRGKVDFLCLDCKHGMAELPGSAGDQGIGR